MFITFLKLPQPNNLKLKSFLLFLGIVSAVLICACDNGRKVRLEINDNNDTTLVSFWNSKGQIDSLLMSFGEMKVHGYPGPKAFNLYDDNKRQERIGIVLYEDSLVEPVLIKYYPSGRLKAIEEHRNNKLSGLQILFYDDTTSSVKFIGVAKDGVFDGPFKIFRKNGSIQIIGNYKSDTISELSTFEDTLVVNRD